MATSPIYSWPEPDNTDLVKNGALAIRTLGNAIDTTMGTMVAKTIIDAKGDLIAGTAADTAARLAVGTNNYFLGAASAESTGLKWLGASIAYTPVWTSEGTAPSLGNGTLTGSYIRVGDFVSFNVSLVWGSTTTNGTGGYRFTLPFAINSSRQSPDITARILDNGVVWYTAIYGDTANTNTTDTFQLFQPDATDGTAVGASYPMAFNNLDAIYAMGTYRVGAL